jgi:hypothetical protein
VEKYEDFEVEGDEPRERGEEVASVGFSSTSKNSFLGLSIAFFSMLVQGAGFSVHGALDACLCRALPFN